MYNQLKSQLIFVNKSVNQVGFTRDIVQKKQMLRAVASNSWS